MLPDIIKDNIVDLIKTSVDNNFFLCGAVCDQKGHIYTFGAPKDVEPDISGLYYASLIGQAKGNIYDFLGLIAKRIEDNKNTYAKITKKSKNIDEVTVKIQTLIKSCNECDLKLIGTIQNYNKETQSFGNVKNEEYTKEFDHIVLMHELGGELELFFIKLSELEKVNQTVH